MLSEKPVAPHSLRAVVFVRSVVPSYINDQISFRLSMTAAEACRVRERKCEGTTLGATGAFVSRAVDRPHSTSEVCCLNTASKCECVPGEIAEAVVGIDCPPQCVVGILCWYLYVFQHLSNEMNC